jgi:hypothetical protein
MLSVKQRDKSAYVPQGVIQQTVNLYGREWDYVPTLYFLFAYECGDLVSFNRALGAQMASLAIHERVDMACLLSKGVLVNASNNGTYNPTPSPGSVLSSYETSNALLVFYLLASSHLLQASTRPMLLQRYIPQDLPL